MSPASKTRDALWEALISRVETLHQNAVERPASKAKAARLAALAADTQVLAHAIALVSDHPGRRRA